jgi:hypothetical protein
MPDDILKEAQEAFELIAEHEDENRRVWEDNVDFALQENQWPEQVRRTRELEGRPCLTVSKLAAMGRQVVNDARQNKPGIIVHPADSEADPETAEVFNGLIRNIEVSSNAEVAYDTALEHAVFGGFGYFRINTAYTSDDTFDQDIVIERISNPLSVYADCYSTAADSSDWNTAFVTTHVTKAQFEKDHKGADPVNWEGEDWRDLSAPWIDGDNVMLAEYWKREEVPRRIVLLSDQSVVAADEYAANKALFDALGVTGVGEREVRSHKVTQRLLSGADELSKVEWAGRYIPIIPVYGSEVNFKGKRSFRSLIQGSKDSQRMFNYWRTTSTELVALAPKAPWVGRKGAFETDAAKWATANTQSHAFIEYDGPEAPMRQPFAGIPAGALQEALNAADDIKATMGIYDASLGARSNETSGKAIIARQMEGDTATFHFIDNLSRAIRHAGRVLIDLIPQVYGVERMVRILGPENEPQMVKVNGPTTVQQKDPQTGELQEIERVFDLTAGKYDCIVKAGPSFNTRREEAASQMIELIRAYPDAAPVIGDLLAKNLDWPGADEVADRLKGMMQKMTGGDEAPEGTQNVPHEVIAQVQQQMQELQQQNQALANENQQLKDANDLKARELEIKAFDAETKRLQAMKPEKAPTSEAA